jgi:SagB-type dehydrogenase family enzyme
MNCAQPFPAQSFAQFYHECTKYSPEGLRKNPHYIDFDKQPIPFKDYEGYPQIDLSQYLPLSTNPFSDKTLKKSNECSELEKPLAELSRILYFTNGVTAIVPYPPRPLLMRAAPSAGGLYPNEIYLVTKNFPDSSASELKSGLFNFQVKTHSLSVIGQGENYWNQISEACFNHSSIAEKADLAIIITGVFDRSSWRYKDRAYRRILLDAGHVWGNLAMVSHLFGKKAYPIAAFNDDLLNETLGLDSGEKSLLVIPLVSQKKAEEISLVKEPLLHSSPVKKQTDWQYIPEGLLLNKLHELSSLHNSSNEGACKLFDSSLKEYAGENQDAKVENFIASEQIQSKKPIQWEKCSLMTSILKRRSARHFDPGMFLTKDQLANLLEFTFIAENKLSEKSPSTEQISATDDVCQDLQICDQLAKESPKEETQNNNLVKQDLLDKNPLFISPNLFKYSLIVNNVEGLDAGSYNYHPEQRIVRQTRFKEVYDEIHQACLNQDMARDAAAIFVVTCNLPKAIGIYGERAYRHIHLDAGHIAERLCLACTKTGIGASPIGGYFDDLVNSVLGINATDEIIVHIVTIGHSIDNV